MAAQQTKISNNRASRGGGAPRARKLRKTLFPTPCACRSTARPGQSGRIFRRREGKTRQRLALRRTSASRVQRRVGGLHTRPRPSHFVETSRAIYEAPTRSQPQVRSSMIVAKRAQISPNILNRHRQASGTRK